MLQDYARLSFGLEGWGPPSPPPCLSSLGRVAALCLGKQVSCISGCKSRAQPKLQPQPREEVILASISCDGLGLYMACNHERQQIPPPGLEPGSLG